MGSLLEELDDRLGNAVGCLCTRVADTADLHEATVRQPFVNCLNGVTEELRTVLAGE